MAILPHPRLKPFLPISAKAFRRQVLRPVQGVFLFHPRALERLIHQHQDHGLLSRNTPALSYYLIPREVFLVALEDENPDALSVIEGIDLPRWVILLPTPLATQRISTPPDRLLYQYWARRFEAEVARAWQQARDEQRDLETFAPAGLQQLIGAPAMREIRAVLERDRLMLMEQDDSAVLRQFVGLATRLRYFAPSLRTLWFPAIRDWQGLDNWLLDSGLDLPPPPQVGAQQALRPHRLPPLLSISRPQNLRIGLQPGPELPLRLAYPANDPILRADDTSAIDRGGKAGKPSSDADDSGQPIPSTQPALQRFCLNALKRPPPRRRRSLWRLLRDWSGRLIGRLIYRLPPRRPDSEAVSPSPLQRRIRAAAFHRQLQTGKKAERSGHLARAIRACVVAGWHYQHLAVDWLTPTDPVLARLDGRLERLCLALADGSRTAWGADIEQRDTLLALLLDIVQQQREIGRIRAGSRLIHQIDQAIVAARTDFLGISWLPWIRALGRQPLRQPLPYQSGLKAVRALDAAIAELDNLPWTGEQVERYRPPLSAARATLGKQLGQQITPALDSALETVGLQPADHRQAVALAKLKAELADIAGNRYHLRFSDVRDAVARNDLPLTDLKAREYLAGDRLGRLDRRLAERLPGFYRPGEIYLKGLQRLSSWLFGSGFGRLLTRYLLMPFGAALVIVVVIEHLLHLFGLGGDTHAMTNLWPIGGLGLLLNGLFHTDLGRRGMASVWRGISVAFMLVVFHGLRNLLSWGPLARMLRNPTVRELSRYLVEPAAIGLLTLVPVAALVLWVLPQDHDMPWEVFALGFVLGSFLRNTLRGRRILDAASARLMLFWMRVRHTLVSGLFRLVVDFFKRLLDGFEQALYRLEELARYRVGEPLANALVKSAVRPIGATLSYVARFYVTVLVEPQVNPIKHFPVVTVSHKMILPALPALTTGILTVLDPLVPRVISLPLVTATILLLPGFFGFLVWELKENWKLFAANRPSTPRPVLVGQHGETLRVMLRRGFHAGTVPKSFDRLRRLLSDARDSGETPRVKLRRAEATLLHNQHEIALLHQRELWASLEEHRDSGRLTDIDRITANSDYLATASVDMSLRLHPKSGADAVFLDLRFAVNDDELQAHSVFGGPVEAIGTADWQLIETELKEFCLRCAARYRHPANDLAAAGDEAASTVREKNTKN